MDKVLDQLAAVIITFVKQDIHQLVTVNDAEQILLIKGLDSYCSSMRTTLDDPIEELMLKHKMRLNVDIMLNQYYLASTKISDNGTSEEIDNAYSACTRAYVSAKGLIDQYHTLALRAQGHRI